MQGVEQEEENPNYLVMGDFNDGPDSQSIRHLLLEKPLYNPMQTLQSPHRGSAKYGGEWTVFDQILLSHTFLKVAPGTHSFDQADIFDEHFLQEWDQPYKGKPFRTFAGKKYLGGYSDHFPVYVRLTYHSRP
jgi:endonuclease/exonuclease/phosphatase family metal-dependent hydrolase